ncbi:MAG: FtsX-like permease family protein [Spirochaetaceae bacterium]|jgi:ABC-type lipoprotein release transport system permease subunit|nr:FtsX-like permease family protein [Spirochaetaceae bacterium]
MKIKELCGLSVKYVVSYRRRYLFLFSALALGFCIISVIGSLKDGMADAIYYSAQNHYSGDIIIAGFEKEIEADQHIYAETVPLIMQKIEEAGIEPDKIILRTMENNADNTVYYNGNAVQLKYVTGVDWKAEADYFNALNFTEGSLSPDFDDNTILLSAPVAAYIGAHAGDIILLETETLYGQKNTAFFTIGGIVDDRSLFGYYKSFVSRRALNAVIGFAAGDCSTIGLFFDKHSGLDAKRKKLQAALEGVVPLRPLVYDRDGFSDQKDWNWAGVMFFLLTVSVYVSEVTRILQALNIIAYFLYVMMLLIILVSAGVTYRLILHERTKEIGTMRAIGFYGKDIRRVLLVESFILATASLVTGFCLTLFINWLASRLSFSWFPSFEIFLKNGRLQALYNPLSSALNIAAIYVILFWAVYVPSFSLSRGPLPELLSGASKE